MKYLLKGTVATALSACAFFANAASDVTGSVGVINVNEVWGGVMVQLVGAPKFEMGSACAESWAFVPSSSPLAKQLMASLMLAKSTGERVRIATSGCISTSMGSLPRLSWVDYGTRSE